MTPRAFADRLRNQLAADLARDTVHASLHTEPPPPPPPPTDGYARRPGPIDWTTTVTGTIGHLTGIPVVLSPFAPLMRPMVFSTTSPPKIVARYTEDVIARLEWEKVKAAMRADLRQALDAFTVSVLGPVCGCPTNEAGDIRCHVCRERVNVRCWNCRTPRGDGPCPNPRRVP